ncbi:hypothetical protein MASR2M78_36700 [Treponema sp.]
MSVFVSIEDKEGEALAPVLDVDLIQKRFASATESVCLRFISDDNDASFNSLQMPLLLKELEALVETTGRADEKEELTKIIRLVKRYHDISGMHARFYGERKSE